MLGGGFFCGLYSRLIFRSLSLFLQFFTVCFFSYFPAFAYFHHCPHISIPYKYIKNQMILSYFSLILFTKYVLSLCYNKDKSGNPLKIKENRTCPYSFSNHIPSKIRPLRLRSERRCYVRDKAKFAKPGARTYWNRKQNTAVQRNCRSLAPAQVKCPPTQWTASTPQDQYTLFQGNTQEKSCGWTGPSCVLPDTV